MTEYIAIPPTEEDYEEEVSESYIQSLFSDENLYADLLNGLSNKAKTLIQDYSSSDDAVTFREGIENDEDGTFLFNQLQSAITREFRMVSMRELYEAVDMSDSYGTQAEINLTSISGILSDVHIGIFTVQQLLSAPHCTERIDVASGRRELVGVGLRHRIATLTLLAHASGVDICSDEWLDQLLEVQISCSINANGEEDTELSGALVLADNASRKAYQGEKASFKLNALGVSFDSESLVAAAFTGRISASEAFGTTMTLYADNIQRKSTTLLGVGKSFYSKAKKYINSKADFTAAVVWIVDNFNVLESKFIADNDSANIARQTAKFSTFVFDSWKVANRIQEPLKNEKKKTKKTNTPKFFQRSI